MKNYEMFEQTFGFKPDTECPFPSDECVEQGGLCAVCKNFNWWNKEYVPCITVVDRSDEDDE